MKSLVIGATRGLGRALAEALAQSGHELFLVASSYYDLNATASDLQLQYDAKVKFLALDLQSDALDTLKTTVHATFGRIDNLFLVAGFHTKDQTPNLSLQDIDKTMDINLVAPVKLISLFLDDLTASSFGNCVGLGSIAATRGRCNALYYGSAKRGLEFYFESLRHHLSDSSCAVQFYRLGYLDTHMTQGQDLALPKWAPEKAAQTIVKKLGKNIHAKYLPTWWLPIMWVYQCLPWWVFKRLKHI